MEVAINPTEDLDKVKRAVENILGNLKFEIMPGRKGSLLIAKTKGINGLARLYDLLRKERIRDSARAEFFKGLNKTSLTFYLNKQVAYVGHISFSEPFAESLLGPIKIKIHCDNPQKLVEWLAPKTT